MKKVIVEPTYYNFSLYILIESFSSIYWLIQNVLNTIDSYSSLLNSSHLSSPNILVTSNPHISLILTYFKLVY